MIFTDTPLLTIEQTDNTQVSTVRVPPGTTTLTAGGGGTVTDVSVVTANGVSGSVATSTTTPAITLTLGAITPTSVNGLTIDTTTGGLDVANGATLTVNGSATITNGTHSGTNTGDQTSVSGNAGTVTVADAGGDTTTWVLLGTSQTGNLSPATDAGLTYNADTNALTATTFVGALNGNATTATSATSATTATTADALSSTLTVPGGGTGLTSATAYAVLCGGTTSTGNFQSVSGLGNLGQVLTSNGAGNLPSFQDVSATQNLPPSFSFPVEMDGANAFLYSAARPLYTDSRNIWIYTSSTTAFHLINMDSGGDVQTRTVTSDLASSTIGGIAKIGSYIYVFLAHASTPKIQRYSLTDLTSSTAMTISGTAIGTTATARMYSNGTSLWLNNNGGNTATNLHVFRNYTISGTTATSGSTVTCGSTSANFTQAQMDVSGNFYGADANGKLYRHDSSGTLIKTGSRNLIGSTNNLYASIEGTPFEVTADLDNKLLSVWKAPLLP